MRKSENQIEDTSNDIVEDNIWSFMHPQVLAISKQRFTDGYYADAVENAFKEINVRVKRLYQLKTVEEKDGSNKMKKVFRPKTLSLYLRVWILKVEKAFNRDIWIFLQEL